MQPKLSRRKLACYVADEMKRGTALDAILQQVAAYLVEARRVREIDLVVRAIEDELAKRGTVVARVTTARPLDATLRSVVKAYVGAPHVFVEEHIDPSVIGGIRVETPSHILDATMKRKLLALRQAKI